MRSIRLKNFRSFEDTQRIELRPITVLVGANSSGKSSFLRFFPLLRQTVETPADSPLLWYSDTGYVDFGDFSETVRRGAEPKAITVELDMELEIGATTLSLTIGELGDRIAVNECVLRANDDICRLVFNASDEVTVFKSNGLNVFTLNSAWRPRRSSAHLVPDITPFTERGNLYAMLPIHAELVRLLRPMMHGRTSDNTAERMVSEIRYSGDERVKTQLRLLRDSEKWERRIEEMDPAGQLFRSIQALLLVKAAPEILTINRGAVNSYAKGVSYLGPFRAPPERFYRRQALAIRQIDPHGKNLVMFLGSLPDRMFHALSKFVRQYLGFALRMRTEGSHVSILIEEENGQAFNLIDMGYGFSQVLPVVTQAWATARGFRTSVRDISTTLLALEQPELHLHPYYQARLADVLVGTVKAGRAVVTKTSRLPAGIQILVETHSEALISRLGELVEDGQIATEDVSVLLFEKDPGTGVTTIRQSHYAEDGTLVNWPIGFFAP